MQTFTWSEKSSWGRMHDQLEVCIKDWAELADEYRELELKHKEYREVSSGYCWPASSHKDLFLYVEMLIIPVA